MNYEKDIKIDEAALDVEWLDQSQLMRKYTRRQSYLQQKEDEAKEELELTDAELDHAIRSDPDKFDIDKLTESVVRNTITRSEKHQEAVEKHLAAKFENNSGKGAVRAVDQRKTALENLVRLHGQNYFAGPSVPRNLEEEVEKKQKRANTKVKSRMKRTK